jgi:hypothetical protein
MENEDLFYDRYMRKAGPRPQATYAEQSPMEVEELMRQLLKSRAYASQTSTPNIGRLRKTNLNPELSMALGTLSQRQKGGKLAQGLTKFKSNDVKAALEALEAEASAQRLMDAIEKMTGTRERIGGLSLK